MHSQFQNYDGLSSRAKQILFTLEEQCNLRFADRIAAERLLNPLLASRFCPDTHQLDEEGVGLIQFSDGTIIEVFVQRKSEAGDPDWPYYLALKNQYGQVFESTLWTDQQMESKEENLIDLLAFSGLSIRS